MMSSILELPHKARESKNNIIVHSFLIGNSIDFFYWLKRTAEAFTDYFIGGNKFENNKVRLFSSIFDFPARAKALNTVNHNGYYGCNNCFIKGEYSTKVYFPFVKQFIKRDQKTYQEWIKLTLSDDCKNRIIYGIKGPTQLSKYIDVLKDVLYDFMHLYCEGYLKRYLLLLTNTSNHNEEYYLGKFNLFLLN